MDFKALKAYVMERAKEASTWRGLVLLATACGANITPEYQEAIIMVGVGLAGVLGVLFPDAKKHRDGGDA